jgi:hypothetical protein
MDQYVMRVGIGDFRKGADAYASGIVLIGSDSWE